VAPPGPSCTRANGTLMARGYLRRFYGLGARDQRKLLTWDYTLERVTGIEPALSAWEVCGAVGLLPADSMTCGDLDCLSVSDRDCPWLLIRSGTYRARRGAGPRRVPTRGRTRTDRCTCTDSRYIPGT
jgi:hypothetical protein